MTDTKIKVGDVVAWDKVPSRAMVRTAFRRYALRLGDSGIFVGRAGPGEWRIDHLWGWWSWGRLEESVAVIALDLTGQETAPVYQRLAEVYEVREALTPIPSFGGIGESWFVMLDSHVWPWGFGEDKGRALRVMSERLHAAGWRRGMTAEDAARLLAEAR